MRTSTKEFSTFAKNKRMYCVTDSRRIWCTSHGRLESDSKGNKVWLRNICPCTVCCIELCSATFKCLMNFCFHISTISRPSVREYGSHQCILHRSTKPFPGGIFYREKGVSVIRFWRFDVYMYSLHGSIVWLCFYTLLLYVCVATLPYILWTSPFLKESVYCREYD